MANDLAHLYAKYVEWSDNSHGDYDDAAHDYIKALRAEVERLREKNKKYRAGMHAVHRLIANSVGVAGLHLNGDVALWHEMLSGGTFDVWLSEFSAALDAEGGEDE